MILALLGIAGGGAAWAEAPVADARPVAPSPAGSAAASVLEGALEDELARARTLVLPDAQAPSFVGYDLLDGHTVDVRAEGGALLSLDADPLRTLRVEVRVGSAAFDSSNFASFEPDGVGTRSLPVEDVPVALRREIWLATDQAYKDAVEQFSRKQAAVRDDPGPRTPDRSPAPPVDSLVEGGHAAVDPARLAGLSETLSGVLAAAPGVEVARADARDWQGTRTIRTTEGTRLRMPTGYTVLRVEGEARLPDGSTISDARTWLVRSGAELPAEEGLRAEVAALGRWLGDLRAAPVEEDYLGPVLFEGSASAELFSQLLAPEVVGTPPMLAAEPSEREPPNARLGRRLLPEGWSVVDDATTARPGLGRYAYDHEGVAPRAVELVRDGVLRGLLMSRIPRPDLDGSTGHGRAMGTDRRAAMPAFVTVTPRKLVAERALRRQALRLAAQTGRDYVLVVRRLMPPAAATGRERFAFRNAQPELSAPYEAYRLYADGRTEPVRSVRFSGVDRRVLRDIVAAAPGVGVVDLLDGPPGPDRLGGGLLGGVPVSWDVPSVLIGELEVRGHGGGEPRVLPIPPRSP